ncbi:MAG: signal peptidase II [Oscillospiraceae bacterium]
MVYIALAVAAVLVGVDQLLKYLVVNNIPEYTSMPFIKIGDFEILNLAYVENRGAAFSFLEDKVIFLVIITSLFLIAGIYLLLSKKVKQPALIWSFALIISGGIGNLLDRIFRGEVLFDGYVVDYLEVKLFNFAVFNFADCCVVIGSIMFLIYIIFFDKDLKKVKQNGKT